MLTIQLQKLSLCCFCALLVASSGAVTPVESTIRFIGAGEISVQSLAGEGGASIRGFSVAPDGNLIAVLYERTGSRATAGLWVGGYAVRSKSVTHRIRIGTHIATPAYLASGIKQRVLFTADQKHVIIQDIHSVSVVDAATWEVLYRTESRDHAFQTVMHAAVDGKASRMVVTYGAGDPFARNFHNEVIELGSGKRVSSWQSTGIPQSISPDGTLAIAPDKASYNAGGVTNLQLIDIATGHKVKEISTPYRFNKRHRNETGSVTARFLTSKQVVVTPDNMVDHTGHHSGYTLEIIDIQSGNAVREIAPRHFVPTGELVVSSGGEFFAATSFYASPKAIRSEGKLSGKSKPELLVWAGQDFQLVAEIRNLDGYGLISNDLLPSLSSNLSMIALAQDGKIRLFRRDN